MRKRPGFGSLLIIGGHEDKEGEKTILRLLAKKVGKAGKIVVATVASGEPQASFNEYERVFRGLGVRHVHHLAIESREEARLESSLNVLNDADAVFFTGGDQLKITSQIGDTPIYSRISQIFNAGGLIAGTSAGASVMTETMMVAGHGDESHRVRSGLALAPGFGFLPNVIVDQHFAQRGRIGRLLGAVAQNPRILGIGLDEDTAILVQRGRFQVVGSNAVYVVDGSKVTFSNVNEADPGMALCIYGVKLHVLNQSDTFDLRNRRPHYHPEPVIREKLGLPVEERPRKVAAAK
ncbi:MAG TPA: cyanophycinase [Gemmatimonadaceae bacterium]|jgi:cyanophycinase|nr:cyanophycinase [Gemmatimonadaceae bacterium]